MSCSRCSTSTSIASVPLFIPLPFNEYIYPETPTVIGGDEMEEEEGGNWYRPKKLVLTSFLYPKVKGLVRFRG